MGQATRLSLAPCVVSVAIKMAACPTFGADSIKRVKPSSKECIIGVEVNLVAASGLRFSRCRRSDSPFLEDAVAGFPFGEPVARQSATDKLVALKNSFHGR